MAPLASTFICAASARTDPNNNAIAARIVGADFFNMLMHALTVVFSSFLSHDEDSEGIRNHRVGVALSALCRPWRRGGKLRADEINVVGLGVERQRLGAWHGLHRLLDHEI